MRLNDPLGTVAPKDLTTSDITIAGEAHLSNDMWVVPFKVPGSNTYDALVDCSGYTELSGGLRQ